MPIKMNNKIKTWWNGYSGNKEDRIAEFKDNPGACLRYPFCDPNCGNCDIEAFNAYEDANAHKKTV